MSYSITVAVDLCVGICKVVPVPRDRDRDQSFRAGPGIFFLIKSYAFWYLLFFYDQRSKNSNFFLQSRSKFLADPGFDFKNRNFEITSLVFWLCVWNSIQGVTHQKQSLDFSKETEYMTRRLKSIQNFNLRPGPGLKRFSPGPDRDRDQKKVILQMPIYAPLVCCLFVSIIIFFSMFSIQHWLLLISRLGREKDSRKIVIIQRDDNSCKKFIFCQIASANRK